MPKHSQTAVRMNWSAVLCSVLLGILLFLGVFLISNTSSVEAKSYQKVTSCSGLTVKQAGNSWVTVKKSNGARVNYTGVAQNEYGWWRVAGGVVDFKYTGVAKNDYGWWRIEKGKVIFDANGLFQNEYGWWKIDNGSVDFSFNGLADNQYGTWKVKNGKVDFSYGGLYRNENGSWIYMEKGKFLSDYEGIVINNNGAWYVKNGTVRFDFNGNHRGYSFKNGKVVGLAVR